MRSAVKLIAAAGLLGGLMAAQDDTTLRVDIRLVHLLATVRDGAGRLVGGLTKDNFVLTDNGVPQKIAVFERQTEQPLSVTLLVDNSGSTAKDLRYEVDSVSRFVRALFQGGNDHDRAALFSFNYEVVKQTGFTREHGMIDHSLRQLHGEAGTSLYDAIYLAADELYNREGRHVMVIVTDGADTTSRKDYQAALEAAQRVDAIIYPILVVPIEADAGRSIGGENALTTLAAGTGGRVFVPTLGAALDNAFTQIVNELRTQYYMAYYPRDIPPSRDRFHRIGAAFTGLPPGLHISTRAGYYGESDAPPARSNNNTRILTPH